MVREKAPSPRHDIKPESKTINHAFRPIAYPYRRFKILNERIRFTNSKLCDRKAGSIPAYITDHDGDYEPEDDEGVDEDDERVEENEEQYLVKV